MNEVRSGGRTLRIAELYTSGGSHRATRRTGRASSSPRPVQPSLGSRRDTEPRPEREKQTNQHNNTWRTFECEPCRPCQSPSS